MDVTTQGTITLHELKKVLTDRFNADVGRVLVIFDALRTSSDGEIHYTDFLAAMVSTRIEVHEDMLVQTFKRFDVDNSGFITEENLRQVLGESFGGEEASALISEADVSGN